MGRRRRRPPELYRAPFPLYALQIEPEAGFLITAGGGGAAKTGIKNGVHFLQLEKIGGGLSASLLHSHDTDTRATMNMALAGDVLAAGQDASCHLLRFRSQPRREGGRKPDDRGSGERGPRQRKKQAATEPAESEPAAPEAGAETRQDGVELSVETLRTVQTDFSPDPLQKTVRFNHDRSLLATGGSDGYVRVWQVPTLEKVLEFEAHKGEIEDLTLGPDDKLVTVGRDLRGCVWQKDQLMTGLCWNENLPTLHDTPYRYQACRFGWVPDQPAGLRLFTVQIPHKRLRRPPPCYLTAWDGRSFLPLRTEPCGHEVVSCLNVSESGTFLGLGTVTGSVAIYIAFSLQRLYYIRESHGIVVTDVAFVPERGRGRELLGAHEAALLSVAVDSRCQLHLLPTRRSVPVWLLLLLCAGLVIGAILLLQSAFPGFL
ncbi:prolactin regulatory element-binding protein isoform X1 [Tachyglossus aculeatus]|uniref:prolactin regulatory element-binding protein isoform X1 n=1 Tax=Tachyglossus aculeatus TaxID=9261 RepID=UPI0018F2C2F5|nr:prolactin regulatory element-binding protein isoform X1 [Tachyglossus aculeatus]